MMKLKWFRMLIVSLTLSSGFNAVAGEWKPYDTAHFKKAQTDGKTVVLGFHADWCSTCKKQEGALKELEHENGLESVVGFTVDFDKATDLKRVLKVQKQSTLIVYKGKNEVVRSTGITSKDEIKALISKGI